MTDSLTRLLAEGYTVRPVQPDDVDAILSLYYVVGLKFTGENDSSRQELLEEMAELDLDQDSRVIFDSSGLLVGIGWVELNTPQNVIIDLYLHPDLEATDTSIMPYLTTWADERARIALTMVPQDQRVMMTAWAYHNDVTYQRNLGRIGMNVIRSSYQMWIDFDEPLPATPLPEGYTLDIVRAGEDWHPTFRVKHESFQDMWGYLKRPYEEDYADWSKYWNNRFTEGYWLIARYDGEIVAVCLADKEFLDDENVAYIGNFGVLREHRQRGLGLALLKAALAHYQSLGKRAVSLHVDASSLTGAVRLYERAGMHVKMRYDRLEKELRAGVENRVLAARL